MMARGGSRGLISYFSPCEYALRDESGGAMDESGDEDSDLDDWADEFEKELG